MPDVNLVAPNGAVYIFEKLTENVVKRLMEDPNFADCLLCLAFRSGMQPTQGIAYYDPQWDVKYRQLNQSKIAVAAGDAAVAQGQSCTLLKHTPPNALVGNGSAEKEDNVDSKQALQPAQTSKQLSQPTASGPPPVRKSALKGFVRPLQSCAKLHVNTAPQVQSCRGNAQSANASNNEVKQMSKLPPFKPSCSAGKRLNDVLTPPKLVSKKLSVCESDPTLVKQMSKLSPFKPSCSAGKRLNNVLTPPKLVSKKLSVSQGLTPPHNDGVDLGCASISWDDSCINNDKQFPFEMVFEGMPHPHFKEHFDYHLKTEIQRRVKNVATTPELFETPQNLEDNSSLRVRFSSQEVVHRLSASKRWEYRGQVLTLKAVVTNANTNTIQLRNLPHPCFSDFLIMCLEEKLRDCKHINIDCNPEGKYVLSFSNYCDKSNTADVEFASPEIKEVACAEVCSFMCDGNIVTLHSSAVTTQPCQNSAKAQVSSKPSPEVPHFDADVMTLPSGSAHQSSSKASAQESSEASPEFPLGSDEENEEVSIEPHITLNSKEGTKIFLRNLVRLKAAFSTTNHTAGYTRLEADLKVDEKVICDVTHLKAKRLYYQKEFNKHRKNGNHAWEYYNVMAVLKGDRDVRCLDGTDYDPLMCASNGDFSLPQELSKFTRGAVWSKISTVAIIELRAHYKARFDSGPSSHSALWKRVAARMEDMGFFYLPSQCENRMDTLMALYRKEYQRRNTTGASAHANAEPPFPFFDDMETLMWGDVTIEPLLTISAGSSNCFRERSDLNEVGKKKSKYIPLKARTVVAVEGLVACMQRKNDLAERYMNASLSPQ